MTQTLNNFFKKVINNYKRNRAAKETIAELAKLNNRELNDIGLSRCDIRRLAYEDAAQRYPSETANPVDKLYANPNMRGWV